MKTGDIVSIKELHHAYLIAGHAADGAREALAALTERGVETQGNPDVYLGAYQEFGVDEARAIAEFASLKPLNGMKYIIISWSRATPQAQNALLKSLEDASSSVFFISVDSAGHALPTIRSRCVILSASASLKPEDTEGAREFLRASYEERLSKVEKLVSAISKTQDREPSRAFVRSLIAAVHGTGASASALRDLEDADRYLRMQGGSAKSVLAHLAVTLPRG